MMEIVNPAKSVLGEEFKLCAGNAHTVSRVAAGLAFAGHKVILLGRYLSTHQTWKDMSFSIAQTS